MSLEFSLSRFWRVLRYDWHTQPIYPYLAVWGLLPLLMYFNITPHYRSDASKIMLTTLLYTGSALYAAMSFQQLSNTQQGRHYLGLPAAAIEKWLSKFTLVFLVFPVLTVLYYALGMGLLNSFLLRKWAIRYPILEWSSPAYWAIFFIFYLLLPIPFVSGLFWKRFGGFKTALVILLSAVLFVIVVNELDLIQSQNDSTMVLSIVHFQFGTQIRFPAAASANWKFWWFGVYIPDILLLLSSYFLLKNKEL
jgi:hypothetical protein